jgi:hypothetical protein
MRKKLLICFLGCLPFTQITSIIARKLPDVLNAIPGQTKPAPELPLNVLHYFIQ